MGHSKGSPERTFIAIKAYLKKIETFQTNDVTYANKNSRNNKKESPELVEGRK